jgi:DNA (cytosine-5)-methyltransferase 1
MACFYEFFAGGGMARAGLGAAWNCLFANDFDVKKAASYAENWGDARLRVEDVAKLDARDLPGCADLAWASFPCQDLSLAGVGAGLEGQCSGAFWPFWRLIENLAMEGRAPTLIVLENVCGALSSHDGKDFAAISEAMSAAGYCFGAVVINALHFLPQSRPRLFIIGARANLVPPPDLISKEAHAIWYPPALIAAYEKLSPAAKKAWIWWRLPMPPVCRVTFSDLLETEPEGVVWQSEAQTRALLAMMSPAHRAKVEAAQRMRRRVVGAVYKRTRMEDLAGKKQKVQRAEIRLDDIAGCLRTPSGGSSRQTLLIIEGDHLRSRLLSPREAARLMGLPDHYRLPKNYTEAYHLAGDGVAVPVVRFLAQNLLEPLVAAYTDALAEECQKNPLQRFNSFPFLASSLPQDHPDCVPAQPSKRA